MTKSGELFGVVLYVDFHAPALAEKSLVLTFADGDCCN